MCNFRLIYLSIVVLLIQVNGDVYESEYMEHEDDHEEIETSRVPLKFTKLYKKEEHVEEFPTKSAKHQTSSPENKIIADTTDTDLVHNIYSNHEDKTKSLRAVPTTTLSTKKSTLSSSMISTAISLSVQSNRLSSTWGSSQSTPTFYILDITRSTRDPDVIRAYLEKIDRDRFYLKIFGISVIVVMSVFATTLITIHIVRKTNRYRGYGQPTNHSSHQ